LELARDAAKQNLVDKNEVTKRQYDKFAKYPTYTVGQKVMLHEKRTPVGKSPKLWRTWVGPFEIVQAYDNFLFQLKNCSTGKIIKSRIHSNRLKPYVERTRVQRYRNAKQEQATNSDISQPQRSVDIGTGAQVSVPPQTSHSGQQATQATVDTQDTLCVYGRLSCLLA